MIGVAEDEMVREAVWGCGLLRGAARCFRRSEQGVALTEFALVFPIMIIMFIGVVEFGEAFSVNRKISNAASTVSDLVSQESSVNNAELQDIATVANELVKPYRTAPFTLRIISVVADNQNRTTVAWSYPAGARAVGSAYTLPSRALTEPNSSLIVAETSYAFTPSVGYFIGDITLRGIAYFRPRLTRTVGKAD
jgi:Flp pilus assembly protein TadG